MEAKALFAGTSASMGVPLIGCNCPVCLSNDPKNNRLRPSLFLNIGEKKMVIDIGPDFRQQALKYGLHDIDGILLTHGHCDHIGGLEDLRIFNFMQKKAIPCLLSSYTFNEIQRRFGYLFAEDKMTQSASFDFSILPSDFGKEEFASVNICNVTYYQGSMPVSGFKIGNLAYISDIKTYDQKLFEYLHGIDILIISAPRKNPSVVHLGIDQAIEIAQKLGAKKTYLTHIAHEVDHNKVSATLPQDVYLSYDGLEVPFVYD